MLFALKMDYLIAPKFHQFYPIVDPWSTGSQHHNFDRICLILQECIALMTSYLHAKHRTCTGPFLYYRLHFLVRACIFLGDSRSTYPPLEHTLDWFPIGKNVFNGLLLFVNEYSNRLQFQIKCVWCVYIEKLYSFWYIFWLGEPLQRSSMTSSLLLLLLV